VSIEPAAIRDRTFTGEDWYARDFGSEVYVDCTFRDVDLTEATSQGTTFQSCVFATCRLNASSHIGSAFVACEFRRTSFFGATLEACKLDASVFIDCTLRPSDRTRGAMAWSDSPGSRADGPGAR